MREADERRVQNGEQVLRSVFYALRLLGLLLCWRRCCWPHVGWQDFNNASHTGMDRAMVSQLVSKIAWNGKRKALPRLQRTKIDRFIVECHRVWLFLRYPCDCGASCLSAIERLECVVDNVNRVDNCDVARDECLGNKRNVYGKRGCLCVDEREHRPCKQQCKSCADEPLSLCRA